MQLIIATFKNLLKIDTVIVYDDHNKDLSDIMDQFPYTTDDILTWNEITI